MPRIIFKCRYLKHHFYEKHLPNYVRYIATREGVDKIDDTAKLLPATLNQIKFINQLTQDFPDTVDMFEYQDYLQSGTRGTASDLISRTLENNIDLIEKRENYVNYIAQRPRVERIGSHGLFTDSGVSVALSQVAEEVANHQGNIWTNIISLRREDAARLGYDKGKRWRDLLRSQTKMMAENMKIPIENFRWFAAFHDESFHPHIHIIAFSTNPKEAYLTEQGIERIRSTLAKEIFKQDLLSIYTEQTKRRDTLTTDSKFVMNDIIGKINEGIYENQEVEQLLVSLSSRLQKTSGKKQYGYLKSDVKNMIDHIVDELAKDERVAKLYDLWYEKRFEVLKTYKDTMPEKQPLSQQKEFKSIKNMIIAEAIQIDNQEDINSQPFTFEPDEDMDNIDKRIGIINEDEIFPPNEEPQADIDSSDTIPKNISKAVELLTKSAEQGNQFAQYTLGKLYLSGEDVPKDVQSALHWLELSAEQDNQYALYILGKLYLFGRDVEQNTKRAVWLLTASAKLGSPYAALLLRNMGQYHNAAIVLAVSRLLQDLGRLFENKAIDSDGKLKIQTDRKQLREIEEKRAAHGLRQ